MIWYEVAYRYTSLNRITVARFPKEEDAQEYLDFLQSKREKDAYPPLGIIVIEPYDEEAEEAEYEEKFK